MPMIGGVVYGALVQQWPGMSLSTVLVPLSFLTYTAFWWERVVWLAKHHLSLLLVLSCVAYYLMFATLLFWMLN